MLEHDPKTATSRYTSERLCRICQKQLTLDFDRSTHAYQVYQCETHPDERVGHHPGVGAEDVWQWESAAPARDATPPFKVTWRDGTTTKVELSSGTLEHGTLWFFKFKPGNEGLVAVKFPNELYERLPKDRSKRYQFLTQAIIEWASAEIPTIATSALTLTAWLDGNGLSVS